LLALFTTNAGMNKLLLSLLLITFQTASIGQNLVSLQGRVIDKQTNKPLEGATIAIQGIYVGTTTDHNGNFVLRHLSSGKKILLVSHIGYLTVEHPILITGADTINVNLALEVTNAPGEQIVVSASKNPEKVTYAPASIQLVTAKDIDQFAGSNITELFSKVSGLQYTRAGVDDITFNARGLHSAFNNKVFQIVDGRNTMAAASAGLPLFNNGSTTKDDIEQIEIVLGPQSALYGPNAHNALFNYITKDPRKYQGTTVSVSAGNQHQFSGRIRHALQINQKWAYKLSGEHATGKDYEWYDSVYVGNQPPGTTPFFGPPKAIPERIYDFTFKRYRGEAQVYFSGINKTDIIVAAGGSRFTRLQVTTSGRNQLRDVTYGFYQVRLVHPRFYLNLYHTSGNLGHSLLLGSYTRDFWNRTHSSLSTGPNRYLPPDSAEAFASRLGNTIKEESQRINGEIQYNYLFQKAGLNLVTGLSLQEDKPNGFGVSLIDSFKKIKITQYGAVLQLDKTLPWQLRLVGIVRMDHHSNLGNFAAPRLAVLKKIGPGNLRVTWGRAYAMPSIQNQYAGINRFLFGNGSGIKYIPNGTPISNPATYLKTVSLKPEEVNTWETGYKANITSRLYVDINYYNGLSKNFISPPQIVLGRAIAVNDIPIVHNPAFAGSVVDDTLKNASFLTFFNYGNVRAYGLDAALTYNLDKHLHVTLNYSWFGSDINNNNFKNDANKDGYVSAEEKSINAPANHITGILSAQKLVHGRMFINLSTRFVQEYDFYSGSQIGTAQGMGKRGYIYIPGKPVLLRNFDWGPLGSFTTFDLEAGYKISNEVILNGIITNLLNTRQIEFVGSPSIGRIVLLELKMQIPAHNTK
jgi:outer membrane receptor for ferrienterochelin and colicins